MYSHHWSGVTQMIKKNERKAQRGGYIGMLLDKLGASFLGKMSAASWEIRADNGVILAGNWAFGSRQGF